MKAQISSTCTCVIVSSRIALSWYSEQAAPTSARSFVMVLIDTSAKREAARIDRPSTSIPMICARFSMGKRFMLNAPLLN